MTEKYFSELAVAPDFLSDIIALTDVNNQQWQEHFGFNAIELDHQLIQADPALRAVNSVQAIGRLGLLMIKPSTFYKWHKDAHRLSCLNMLVSRNHNSHTLFGEEIDGLNMSITELRYKPDTLYLFNNQAQHCVINLDGPRYLFSLYFASETPYEIVRQRLSSANLLRS